jgi:hypothetical protein
VHQWYSCSTYQMGEGERWVMVVVMQIQDNRSDHGKLHFDCIP